MYECQSVTLGRYLRHNEASNCQCPRQCRRLNYRYRISQARLSNFVGLFAKAMLQLDESLDKILRDHCSLEVCVFNVPRICLIRCICKHNKMHKVILTY